MGKTIFLNGCSSAGKTTLAIMLQQLLDEPYQHLALDQFRDGMPLAVRGLNSPAGSPGSRGLNVVPVERNGELVTTIEFGDYGRQVLAGMRRTVALFASMGMNVIVDDLIFEAAFLQDYVAVLEPSATWFIGVRCDLDVAKRREAVRVGRFPGTATAHFDQIHDHGEVYDLEVDTTYETPREVAERIIARMAEPPLAFARMRRARS